MLRLIEVHTHKTYAMFFCFYVLNLFYRIYNIPELYGSKMIHGCMTGGE